ncbi:MAG: ribose 5-phosphate isomerase B [Oscillospiraceae bacterium]|nr:ribose 5-phosphate isomerase B [Oscillospiraceae bacterium]
MIALGSDHGGFALKQEIKKFLDSRGIEYKDFGTYTEESCDYPQYAKLVCDAVVSGECEKGVLCCGTGIGISIAANKVKGIRAALCSDYFSAKYTRLHNDANVICMGGRTIGPGLALELVDVFLSTPFEGGRHQRRIDQITELENRG